MIPDARSAQRFFQAALATMPVEQLSHLHLVHGSSEYPFPIALFLEQGFQGRVTAARSSIVQALQPAASRLRILLEDHPTAGEAARHIMMEMPQGREAWVRSVRTALATLAPEGKLWLFGAKEEGILSVAKRFSGVESVLYKGHLRLLSIPANSQLLDAEDQASAQIFAHDPFYYFTAPDGTQVATLPSVFSWREADPASQLLLEVMREPGGERILDWGCGSGLLGVSLARRWPGTQVMLSDDLWSAVRSAQRTAELNGVAERCEVVAEDGIGAQLRERRFDAIVSNPPFHRGVRTDHEPARRFVRETTDILRTGGVLWLVCNHFLDYGSLMSGPLVQVERVVNNGRFAVWRGMKPAPAAASRRSRG